MARQPGILSGAGRKLAAESVGRLLQFALAYYAQVRLGPTDYGTLVYALAAGLVASQLADAGLQLHVTREMAKDVYRAGDVARAGLRLKTRLALAAGALLALVAVTRPPGVRFATWAAAAAVVSATFVEYAAYGFRGLHRVADDALLGFVLRMTTVTAGITVLWWGVGLTGFALTQLLAAAAVALAACLWLGTQLPPARDASAPMAKWTLLAQAWPLGAAILVSILHTRVPTFLLDADAGANAVGMFGVAQRLIEPASLLPAAVLAAAFPSIVRDSRSNPPRARTLRRRTVLGLAGLGALVATLGVAGGPTVVRLLYGGPYAAASRPLQILSAATVLTFANYALTHFLVSLDRQHALMRINLVVLGATLVSCWLLIPRLGPSGAALGLVVGEGTLCLACLLALARSANHHLTVARSSPDGPAS